MTRRFLVIVGVAVALAGCANHSNRWTPLQSRVVGQQPGDTIETLPGAYPPGSTSTAISVVRSFDQDGMLALCGAVIFAAPAERLEVLKTFVSDRNSILKVGEFGDGQRAVSPKFMRVYALPVPNGILDAKAVDYSTLMGDCVRTEVPWRAGYAAKHSLDLEKTIPRR